MSAEKALSAAQGEVTTDSVYDFLYHDSRRIGSFLSQFDKNGLLTGISQHEAVARVRRGKWKVGVGGELPLLAGAKLEVERDPGEAGSETFERSYDPFWTNALAFLDFLSERELVRREIENAALGQFVLVKGHLSILDLAMLKDAWALETVQAAARAGQSSDQDQLTGNRKQRRTQGHASSRASMPSEIDLTLDLLKVLPHTVHASIMTPSETIWANLKDESLVTPAAELVLTHGTTPPGEWAMLGILSGRPDIGELALQQHMAEVGQELPPGLVNSAIGLMARIMAPLIRTALGRPSSAYAVTPILIFREVT